MVRLVDGMQHRMADEFAGDPRGLGQAPSRHDCPAHGGSIGVTGAMGHIRKLVVYELALARDTRGSAHHVVA